MADKNIQMTQRNSANTDWDNLYPITKGANVKAADGTTTFETHLSDSAKHKYASGCTQTGSGNAEGYSSNASAAHTSHAEGWITTANGDYGSHAEGYITTASGVASHAEGQLNTASGTSSHAGGTGNIAKYCQFVIGEYSISSGDDITRTDTSPVFIIGNGSSNAARGNAFKVLFNGQTYADGAYASTGADYAEFFEWLDGNPDAEERVGYFVTIDGEKIRIATASDDYILGIVSATPSIVGDNYEAWQGKYITDDWGRIQYHEVLVPATYISVDHPIEYDDKGNIVKEAFTEELLQTPEHADIQPMYNPDWDPSKEYISREHRKEWAAIGMMGKLLVRDDGTCQINGYCKPNNSGIATAAISGYRVMKRVSENIIQVLLK